MRRIKKGDSIMVVSGRDKGKQGVVTAVFATEGKPLRCTVEGLNIVHHYTKANPEKGEEGGLVQKEAPMDASKVMLLDSKTGKPSRVGINSDKDRVYKTSGQVIE